MTERLCLRTYAERIRGSMKVQSRVRVDLTNYNGEDQFIDGRQKSVFYNLLLGALSYCVGSRETGDVFPEISNSLITHLRSGEADIPDALVMLAQKDDSVDNVEAYFSDYLIPNIPVESLDSINDSIFSLIDEDYSIGPTTQKRLKEYRWNCKAERFHAEVFVFLVQRNKNKLTAQEAAECANADSNIEFLGVSDISRATEDLQRKRCLNEFQPIEAIDAVGKSVVFGANARIKGKKRESLGSRIADYCRRNSPLFIYGNGGSGKTTFLQLALSHLKDQYSCRFLRFDSLYRLMKEDKISDTSDLIELLGDVEVLILDAINEMTPNGFDRSDYNTCKLCAMAGELCQQNGKIRLIISGTFPSYEEAISVTELIGLQMHLLRLLGIQGNDPQIQKIGKTIGNAFLELIRRPLYYNAYLALDRKKRNKASGRYRIIHLLYEHMCQRGKSKNLQVSGYEAIVNSCLPRYAYGALSEPYNKYFTAEDVAPGFDMVASYLDTIIIKYVTAEGKVQYAFSHQDYRDFLAAMHFQQLFKDIRNLVPVDIPDLNLDPLPGSTVEMLVEAVTGLDIGSEDYDGTSLNKGVKADWWKRFVVESDNFFIARSCMAIGFEVAYYLGDPVRHPATNKNVYYQGYRQLVAAYFKIAEEQVFCPFPEKEYQEWGRIIDKIIYKHIELFRRATEYDKGIACFDEITDYLGEQTTSGLIYHKARLLMDKGQHDGDSSVFAKGFDLLLRCAADGDLVSANNLLGRLYASPAPVVTKFLGHNIRDAKRGFLWYHSTVLATQKQDRINLFGKYAFVRCAKMLLHNEVQLSSARIHNIEEVLQIGKRNQTPNAITLNYAESLLRLAKSKTTYACYLLGMVKYYRKEFKEAVSILKWTAAREVGIGKVLPSLFLYQALFDSAYRMTDEDLEQVIDQAVISQIIHLRQTRYDTNDSTPYESYHRSYIAEDISFALSNLQSTKEAVDRKLGEYLTLA